MGYGASCGGLPSFGPDQGTLQKRGQIGTATNQPPLILPYHASPLGAAPSYPIALTPVAPFNSRPTWYGPDLVH